MVEYVISLLLNILSNLLTPAVQRIFKIEPRKSADSAQSQPAQPLPGLQPIAAPTPDEREAMRRRNRERLSATFNVLVLYGFAAFALWAAIYLPMSLKSISEPMSRGDLIWADTRFSVLSGYVFAGDMFGVFTIAVAAALFLPLRRAAQRIAHLFAAGWDRLQLVTAKRFTFIFMAVHFSLCLLVAGHWFYLLNPAQSYGQALAAPFILMFFGLFFAGSNQSQRR